MKYVKNVIIFVLFTPIIGVFLLILIPRSEKNFLTFTALNFSFLPLMGLVFLWIFYNRKYLVYHKSLVSAPLITKIYGFPNLTFVIDGISIYFLLLIAVLIPICIFIIWDNIEIDDDENKKYFIFFLFLESLLLIFCCVFDFFIFYMFFEIYVEKVFKPIFLILGLLHLKLKFLKWLGK